MFKFGGTSWGLGLGIKDPIVVDKSTNKVQFRQMEKSIQKFSTISIRFSNQQIANFFHDQAICIANCENFIIFIIFLNHYNIFFSQKVRTIPLLPTIFWPTVRENFSSDIEKFANLKGQKNFLLTECFNLCLEVSHI